MNVKTISRFLVVFGVAMIFIAMLMDTTVSTSGSSRVYNIGLVSQQQNLLIIGGLAFIGGIILFATAKLKQAPEDELAEKAKSEPNRIFNYLDNWISPKRDNILGRIAVFLFAAPFARYAWPPLLLLLGIYAFRPVPASKVITHLLYLHMTLDLILGAMFLLFGRNSQSLIISELSIGATFLGLAAISYLIIRYIRRRPETKLT